MQLPDRLHLFGRVIATTARMHSMEGVVMVYLFKTRSGSKELPDRSVLQTTNLLVPPKLTNYQGWHRRCFETIASLPIAPGEVLPAHCFHDPVRNRYYDEANHQLPGPVGPVGNFGLDSYLTIDDSVSDALGIPRA